jgi:cysteine-rich repeat protein
MGSTFGTFGSRSVSIAEEATMRRARRRAPVLMYGLVTLAAGVIALGCACLFDTATYDCFSGLRCDPGFVCALRQQVCIPDGGCGNGIVSEDEVCDDGNIIDRDGCSSDCKSNEVCGNGVTDFHMGEECDPVSTFPGRPPDTAECNSDCTKPKCGDGHLNRPAGEVCDKEVPEHETPQVGCPGLTCKSDCTGCM